MIGSQMFAVTLHVDEESVGSASATSYGMSCDLGVTEADGSIILPVSVTMLGC